MKGFIIICTVVGGMSVGAAFADEASLIPQSLTITGSAGITADYRLRGISQTQKNPAVQVGVDVQHVTGFHLGVWGSNVDFDTDGDGSLEADLIGGYKTHLGPVDAEIGAIYYLYPGAKSSLDYNYLEGYASVAYKWSDVQFGASVNMSPNFFGDSGVAWYPKATASIALPHDFALNGSVGYQFIEDEAAFGVPDYADWSLGVSYTFMKSNTLSLTYYDTNVKKSECAGNNCSPTLVAAFTHQF